MLRLSVVLLGAISMASLVIAAFFYRFWRTGRDRFFLLFALSFLLEGVNRFALALLPRPNEGDPLVYLVRLLSFVLILAAVVEKNRSSPRP